MFDKVLRKIIMRNWGGGGVNVSLEQHLTIPQRVKNTESLILFRYAK